MTRQQKRAQARQLAKEIDKARKAGELSADGKGDRSVFKRIAAKVFGEPRDQL